MRKLIWSKRARNSFGKILDYIDSDSIQNAEKVAKVLLQKLKKSHGKSIYRTY